MIDYYIRKLYGSLEVSYDPTKTYPLEGAFNREIKISTKSSSFIIPVFALGALADFSVEEANNIDSIVISLHSLSLEKNAITEKRAESIFNLVKNFTLEDRLYKIITTKCIYYVGQGIILDSYFCKIKLLKEERLLLQCLLHVIPIIELGNDEVNNIILMSRLLYYLDSISSLNKKLSID